MAQIRFLRKEGSKGKRQRGDPCSVYDDSVVLGDYANSPHIFVVEIPGMPVEEAERVMQRMTRPAVPGDEEFNATDEVDRVVQLGRHRWRLMLSELTPTRRTKLNDQGWLRFNYNVNTINSYFVDRLGLDTFIPGPGGPIDP